MPGKSADSELVSSRHRDRQEARDAAARIDPAGRHAATDGGPEAVDRRGGQVRPPLGLRQPHSSGRAGGQERALGPQPGGRLRRRQHEAAGDNARPGGRPRHADPPAVVRPDRPAADAGRGRAFVKDESPDAYEKVVDRLLASKHFGERMAVYWLDVVRYADTAGYHSDNHRDVWLFRDYVIDAFNANKPFDRFTRRAARRRPAAQPDQRAEDRLAATTACSRPRRRAARRRRSTRPSTPPTGCATPRRSWLGATLGCAECHDHKFDPFTPRGTSTASPPSSPTCRSRPSAGNRRRPS